MKTLLVLLALSGCSWTPRQTALATASTGLLMADWAQTRGIVAKCQEENPVLGECGQRIPLNVYFPVIIAANLAIGALIGNWRDVLFGGVAGVEGATVWSNAINGY